jgi:hypothetical protein
MHRRMPFSGDMPRFIPLSAAAPSTPLGSFADSAVAWTTWVTLMGFVGLAALALLAAGPLARRIGQATLAAVTTRLSRAALVLGVLALPAVLADLAQSASTSGGYDYDAAWNSLYGAGNDGLLSGLEVTFIAVGAGRLLGTDDPSLLRDRHELRRRHHAVGALPVLAAR